MKNEKTKANEKKKIGPFTICPKRTADGLSQLIFLWWNKKGTFVETDFQDRAEFVSFQNIGPLPPELGKRPEEFKNDMNIITEEMELLGLKKGSYEMVRALALMAEEMPTA